MCYEAEPNTLISCTDELHICFGKLHKGAVNNCADQIVGPYEIEVCWVQTGKNVDGLEGVLKVLLLLVQSKNKDLPRSTGTVQENRSRNNSNMKGCVW